MAVNGSGYAFVADTNNNLIRVISPAGDVSTFAGDGTAAYLDGTGTAARFWGPKYLTFGPDGSTLYVSDLLNRRVRMISAAGEVTTLAGSMAGYADGTGTNAQFSQPNGIAVDLTGTVFLADASTRVIRKITPAGVVSLLAGIRDVSGYVNNVLTLAKFMTPVGVAADFSGNVYVADWEAQRIRKIS